MHCEKPVVLTRDVEAAVVPLGNKVVLQAGEVACISQALGGSYTVVVNGNMFRIDGRDADALGLAPQREAPAVPAKAASPEEVEKQAWDVMRTCYDPEIPVNIVDLGLVYDCVVKPRSNSDGFRVEVKMTLTAPGCGMGPVIAEDVRSRVLSLSAVEEVHVDLVWDPPWNQAMMSEAARLQLGLL